MGIGYKLNQMEFVNKSMSRFFSFLMLILIILATLKTYDQDKVCLKQEKEIKKFLLAIKNTPITEIKISKPPKGYETFINSELVISDIEKIDSIRNFIVNRKTETWQKPISNWKVILVFLFRDGLRFELEVDRIENTLIKNRTHIYFNSSPCMDSLPSYSDEIGVYLEKLVRSGQL